MLSTSPRRALESLRKAGGEALTGNFSGARETLEGASDEFGGAYRAFAGDAPVLDNAAFGTKEMDLNSAAITAERFGLTQSSLMGTCDLACGLSFRHPEDSTTR